MILLFVASSTGHGLKQANSYNDYSKAKQQFLEVKYTNDFDIMMNALYRYAVCAENIKRFDVAAWQYNDLAYYYIQEFKDRSDYVDKVTQIFDCKTNKQKKILIIEVKSNFILYMDLLNMAKNYLIKAEILDSKYGHDKERDKDILSNWNFINYVNKFMNQEELPHGIKSTLSGW